MNLKHFHKKCCACAVIQVRKGISLGRLETATDWSSPERGYMYAVSKSMGHSSTKTTETYYCRKSDATVRKEMDRAWAPAGSSEPRKINSGKNDLIKIEKYLSSYA